MKVPENIINLIKQNNSDGLSQLETWLAENNPTELDLGFNDLGQHAVQVAEKLGSCTQLHTLSLRNNNLGQHAVEVVEKIRACTQLHTLNLGSNNLGHHAVEVAEKLGAWTQLQKLYLRYNQALGQHSIEVASMLVGNINLSHLTIHGLNQVQKNAILNIRQESIRNAARIQLTFFNPVHEENKQPQGSTQDDVDSLSTELSEVAIQPETSNLKDLPQELRSRIAFFVDPVAASAIEKNNGIVNSLTVYTTLTS